MANGYCAPILRHITSLGLSDPAKKLRPLGFTQMLLCCMDGSIKLDNTQNGHTNNGFTVKYYERVPESAVSDTATDCDVALEPAYKEFGMPTLQKSSITFAIPLKTIRAYCKDASDMVSLGRETTVMREVYDLIINHARALYSAINTKLVTQMSTQFGVNVTTNSNAVRALKFKEDDVLMRSVVASILNDVTDNEFCNDFCMVGNGPFAAFENMKAAFGNVSAIGFDPNKFVNLLPRVWSDKATRNIWGANQVGLFEKGSLALLSQDQYVGSFAGKFANSERFNMALPVEEFNCPQECLDQLHIDVAIREIDCPTVMTINGAQKTVNNVIAVTLSKDYSLFVKPGTLYAAGDELAGVNGTLRYAISEVEPTTP